MFIAIVVSIFIISVLLSLQSLRTELKKNIKTHEIAASLAKSRVLFIADSSNNIAQPKPREVKTEMQPVPFVSHDIQPSHDSAKDNQQGNEALGEIRKELSQFTEKTQ